MLLAWARGGPLAKIRGTAAVRVNGSLWLAAPQTAADAVVGGGQVPLRVKAPDPLAELLPPGTILPSFHESQITIANIVTHTSGLPCNPWHLRNLNNPYYASLTEHDLLGTLTATQLTRAPGQVIV